MKKLGPATRLSKVFPKEPPEETIHIIVQRPPQVHAPVPSRALTPLPGSLSDGSRPSSPLSGKSNCFMRIMFASRRGSSVSFPAFISH
ncbi:hypothetical protein B0O80DRAFT_475797, partial [Mortierella sp. GBAus27b]